MTNHEPINGVLIVDKPSGWTSHDVVNKTRRLLGVKAGHAGTLDPMATGVLVLLIGNATRQATRFEHDGKRYLAEVAFGSATDTYDADGTETASGDPGRIDRELLARSVRSFEGASEQQPPMYSAVKIGGRRLYDLARAGKTVERKPRPIFIESIEMDDRDFPLLRLDITCSKGTYIRTIAHELGEMTGCPAHLSALRRIASGEFTIARAVDFTAAIQSSDAAGILRRSIEPVSESAIVE